MSRHVCTPAVYRAKVKHTLPKWLKKVDRVKSTTSSAKHTKNIVHRPPSNVPRETITCGIIGPEEEPRIKLIGGMQTRPVVFPASHGRGIGAKALLPPPRIPLFMASHRAMQVTTTLPPMEIEPYVSYGAVERKN